MPADRELEDIEMRLLLEGIFQQYGYDFRDYAPASLSRRIRACMQHENLKTISGLQEKVLHCPGTMSRFLKAVSINVTSLFRDPGFYLAFREKAVPSLSGLKTIRIWHAGCSTGEEVYSIAIVLQEEGLLDRTRIYATDMVEYALKQAKEGIYPVGKMKEYTQNYQEGGGEGSFSNYYTAKYDHVILDKSLGKNIVWAQHNLVTDASFNEFNMIVCRNVMIYFNRPLQARVHDLLYESLNMGGMLGLGSKESLKFTPHEMDYEALDDRNRLYRKVK